MRYLNELEAAWKNVAMEKPKKVGFPTDVIPYLARWRKSRQENVIVITLNGGHEIIRVRRVSLGTVNRCLIHPREIFRPAVKDNAAAVIVAHNHPSGNLEPSREDLEVSYKLKTAGEALGIPMLDFVVFSNLGFVSFCEVGKL